MSAAIPLRDDFNGPELRVLAKGSRDPVQLRRLLALAEIYDGGARSAAARIGGVGLQSIRDWVLRFTETLEGAKHSATRATPVEGDPDGTREVHLPGLREVRTAEQ